MTGQTAVPLVHFQQNAVYASREELRQAATDRASLDGTKLKVLISQPRRVDRARVYLGCTGNGLKAGTSQCTYRVHATENEAKWQITKASFDHSHPFTPCYRGGTSPANDQIEILVAMEFASRDEFVDAVNRRAAHDGVEMKIFVDLGKLSRRARFAMCCSHNSRTAMPKTKRCTYSFVAIEYEDIGWRVTQCSFDHKHMDGAPHTPIKYPNGSLNDMSDIMQGDSDDTSAPAPLHTPASFHKAAGLSTAKRHHPFQFQNHPFALPPIKQSTRAFPSLARYSDERTHTVTSHAVSQDQDSDLASSTSSMFHFNNGLQQSPIRSDSDSFSHPEREYDSDTSSWRSTLSRASEGSGPVARKSRPTLQDLLN